MHKDIRKANTEYRRAVRAQRHNTKRNVHRAERAQRIMERTVLAILDEENA